MCVVLFLFQRIYLGTYQDPWLMFRVWLLFALPQVIICAKRKKWKNKKLLCWMKIETDFFQFQLTMMLLQSKASRQLPLLQVNTVCNYSLSGNYRIKFNLTMVSKLQQNRTEYKHCASVWISDLRSTCPPLIPGSRRLRLLQVNILLFIIRKLSNSLEI